MSNQGSRRSFSRALASVATGAGLFLALLVGLASQPRTATGAVTDVQEDGAALYGQYCAACHQAGGAGLPSVFPPLAGSEWVTGDAGGLIRIVLHGVSGAIEVKGETFNSMMPAWGGVMQDAQVAAVATYVRGAWGNTAGPVTAAEVARVRAANAARTTPWTAQELQAAAAAAR